MTPISVLIADDDAGMRLVMRRLVEQAEVTHLETVSMFLLAIREK